MKTKNYRNRAFTCRSYMKTAGSGFEVGFVFGGRPVFVGNFIHASEANQWYAMMNREIKTFAKRHKVGPKCPKAWFGHFLASHLYDRYYTYLDRAFTRYTKTYRAALSKETRKYRALNRNWYPNQKAAFIKAA